ncbi:SH3 and multiple ankyrin repeat domains protein 3-like isoform X2 [Ostrea edulis]|uniref:SH3 and multiple ankyrin repeat domains protein 3-like isoform X2 n=1 Tax=Ostrea edulis TaxID=37623 RepID=UPI0024AEC432|nr:SH3 and multiple ankyrin repeat domains protein 3-like isoform X2 [Ostrea edulis]XP_056013639.1 SH3 and multiple ankyrin repeat domains protein 3-like isoform X2 [Ostrea edulis]
MVFEMSIQDFNDQTQDHMYPHHNGVVDYREGSFISEEVKGYQEPGVYHSDSQVGTVFIRISVPELKLQKCLQFELDETVWQAKHRVLSSFAKDLKDSINYGLYCPPMNGRAGKFLDEERLLREYPLQGPIGFLEFKYKKRVYKMMHVNVRKLKQLHVKSNLRHFIDYIRTCNIEKVNKMTNKGLDPNFHDSSSGETPLCLAVSMNKPKSREMIISLAGGGAHLDFRNKKGMTALHVAVIAGNTEAIKTLLDLGVSPNMKDSRSLTPLYYTVCHCTGPGCMEMLLQERAFIGSQDEQGWFEIHHACRQGLVQHLEHLLFYGADMDVQNASGNTALHVCALHNRESCLRVLLFRGANKEILNYSSQSPYESAILAGNSVIAEIIEGHKDEDVVTFRETPRFSTRRRDSVASAAMFALYRSRSDPRINHILISPSSSTNSFSHLHNSQNMDSYSGSRGTDSPCSMSLSSSSSGPGFFGKGASASFPLRRPMSVCQSHFPDHNKPSCLSQFEIIKSRLTPANSFRSVQSRDRLDFEFHKDFQRRLSLQIEMRQKIQKYQNLTVPKSPGTAHWDTDQGSDSQSTILSPSMESINSVRSHSPSLSTFSSHSRNLYSSSQTRNVYNKSHSSGDNGKYARDRSKSPNNFTGQSSVCTSDSTIYRVISKPKRNRMPWKNEGHVDVVKQEEIYHNSRIYSESYDKCRSLPANKSQVSRQTSAPAGDSHSSYISADHCPPEATLELETDHIFVCIERYVPRTPEELALEKGDIVEVLGVGEQGFWEGRVNGNEGMFPSNYVQEVKLRRKAGSLGDLVSAARHDMMLNRNTLAAIVPNFSEYAPRSVVLQKGPEGYGFVLRGAKSQTHATGELDFRPTAEFPALQYLDSVDPGSRADRVGLKTGDFILEINGENVVRASHDRVVQLIRHSGDTLALKVVTVKPLEKPDHWLQHHNGTMTLPNRGGPKRQAPQPPQRDPQTSLSVGKAQGKQYAEGMAELDQLDLALAEYEKQSVHSAVSSDQKTASIRSKHSAKRVSCVELDKIENPDSKAATTKGKGKDYMSPSEIRIQKYHHKKGANLERSSSTPSLVDKKTEAVYATPTVPSTEQNDMGHRRSSSGAAISHIYATPGERPRAPPPPPPAGTSTSSPKRPAPAPPTRPQAEIISISTDRRKSSLTSMTDSVHSVEKPASEYESSFRPGISAQLSTEPKISTLSLQQVKLRSHNRNSSQVSVQSTDSGESKRSEEKLGVTFAEDKVQDQAHLFLQKHPNAQLLVTTNIHAKNKDRKMSEPEPDYDSDENDAKVKSKVTVISVGGGVENSKKYTVKSDIPSGEGGMFIPPPPSEPAPKPPSQKPPSPLPKPAKQDIDIKLSLSTEKKDMEQSITKNVETSSVKSEETALSSSTVKFSEPEPRNIPPAPPAPPPPPPAPPAPPPPGVMAPEEKPKTPPPVFEKKPKNPVQGIPSKAIMDAVAQRKTRIEAEGMKISKGPNKEAPVKDGNDLRNRMLDNTHSAILAAVAKRRAVLEEKDSEHTVADEIENRLQKTKKLQSAKYYFSSESIQKKDTEKTNKVGTKTETNAKEITPTIVKPTTPTSISPITTKPPSPVPSKKTKPPSPVPSKKTKPPSPVPSKKTKPPSPVPPRKISPSIPGAKTLPTATKTAKPTATKATEKTQTAPKPIYISSTKPPSPKLKKAPSPIPVQSRAPETSPDKAKATSHEKSSTVGEGKGVEKDENEDLLAKAEKVRQDWLQKKSSSTSLKSPRDVTRNPSKLNSPRRTTSKAGAKTDNLDTKESSAPKMNGMTLPLNKEENKSTSVQSKPSNSAKGLVQVQSAKSSDKSGITPMKTSKDSEVLLKTKNIRDRIANFEKGKPAVNGKSDSDSKIPVHGVTLDSSITDKSPALPPPPEFGDAVQLEIIPPPSGFNLTDNLESPTYSSAFHHSDSSSVSTLSTLSDDHMDNKTKHSYEDLIAPPPPGFDDNSEDSGVIPPPPDFGESKPAMKSNNKTYNKPFLSKPLSGWQCLDVLDWLDSIQMAQYKKSFQQHCIDGKKLGGLQRNDYIQLGVTQVGHRMSMERAIKKASNIITGTHL